MRLIGKIIMKINNIQSQFNNQTTFSGGALRALPRQAKTMLETIKPENTVFTKTYSDYQERFVTVFSKLSEREKVFLLCSSGLSEIQSKTKSSQIARILNVYPSVICRIKNTMLDKVAGFDFDLAQKIKEYMTANAKQAKKFSSPIAARVSKQVESIKTILNRPKPPYNFFKVSPRCNNPIVYKLLSAGINDTEFVRQNPGCTQTLIKILNDVRDDRKKSVISDKGRAAIILSLGPPGHEHRSQTEIAKLLNCSNNYATTAQKSLIAAFRRHGDMAFTEKLEKHLWARILRSAIPPEVIKKSISESDLAATAFIKKYPHRQEAIWQIFNLPDNRLSKIAKMVLLHTLGVDANPASRLTSSIANKLYCGDYNIYRYRRRIYKEISNVDKSIVEEIKSFSIETRQLSEEVLKLLSKDIKESDFIKKNPRWEKALRKMLAMPVKDGGLNQTDKNGLMLSLGLDADASHRGSRYIKKELGSYNVAKIIDKLTRKNRPLADAIYRYRKNILPEKEAQKLYIKHMELAKKHADVIIDKLGLRGTFDDIKEESLSYCAKHHRADKGEFNGYLFSTMFYRFVTYISKQSKTISLDKRAYNIGHTEFHGIIPGNKFCAREMVIHY